MFAKNSSLPFSTFKKYTKAQRAQLIASLIPVTWPPVPPFTDNPFPLLNELLTEKKDVKIVETTGKVVEKETVLKINKRKKQKGT